LDDDDDVDDMVMLTGRRALRQRATQTSCWSRWNRRLRRSTFDVSDFISCCRSAKNAPWYRRDELSHRNPSLCITHSANQWKPVCLKHPAVSILDYIC